MGSRERAKFRYERVVAQTGLEAGWGSILDVKLSRLAVGSGHRVKEGKKSRMLCMWSLIHSTHID